MIKISQFLMAKLKNQWKLIKIDQKWVKNMKIDKKTVLKFHIRNWPPQSACHGSGRWGQKQVKRGPYLYHTLWEIQKQWKRVKNHEIRKNDKNTKNSKNQKIIKTQKSTKSENAKSEKDKKSEKVKVKKWKTSKVEKPQKWSKCQINGTFWHFVFSEPPGPAFFAFWGLWGVPRPL